MKKYTVYCHTNKINGYKYIGITCQEVQDRWRRDGKGYSGQPKFYNAIKKYGWENFSHEILYYGLSEEEACQIERQLIAKFDCIRHGYNVEQGGNITSHNTITREKISESNRGKKHSQQTIDLIAKIKQEQAGIKVVCVETGEVFASMGEASKIKNIDKTSISRCCKGKQITAGGFHWKFLESEKPIEIKDQRKKKVQCLDTGKIYSSVTEAAKDTNSDPSNIIKVCKGKYKTTNKLRWRWIEDA